MSIEKLGVSNEELIIELQAEYARLSEIAASMSKTASQNELSKIDAEMDAIAAKLDELHK